MYSHRPAAPAPMRDLALHRLLFTLLPLFSSVFSAPPPPPLALLYAPPPPLPAVPTTLKVSLVLDINSSVGIMSRTSINMSLSNFYVAHPNSTTCLLLFPRDSGSDVVSAAATAALDLMTNQEVHAIIGPQRSLDAAFMADLATKAQVPVVSSSAISPLLVPSQTPYFVRVAPSDAAQANALATLVQAFGTEPMNFRNLDRLLSRLRRPDQVSKSSTFFLSPCPAFLSISTINWKPPVFNPISVAEIEDEQKKEGKKEGKKKEKEEKREAAIHG